MVRTVLVGALSLVCCSCATLRPSFPSGHKPPQTGEEFCIRRPSVMIAIRDPGELWFYSRDPLAVPAPDWGPIRDRGLIYFGSITCVYQCDAKELDVSSLADYINKCLPAGCSVSVLDSSGTVLKLNEFCPYDLVIVVEKTGWKKGSRISLTLGRGESADLADAETSPFVGAYSVVD